MQRPILSTILLTALLLQACGGYVELDLTLFTDVNLEDEVTVENIPELNESGRVAFLHRIDVDLADSGNDFQGQIGDVVLHEVCWRVPENSMTSDLVDVSIVVAPFTSLSPDDIDSVPLGKIAYIPAGTRVETTPLEVLSAGERALKEHLTQGQFSLFVVGYIEVDDPTSLPNGGSTIEIDLRGEVHKR